MKDFGHDGGNFIQTSSSQYFNINPAGGLFPVRPDKSLSAEELDKYTDLILLLLNSNDLILLRNGKPSNFRMSLSEKSIVSNWSKVAPMFSISGIRYPTGRENSVTMRTGSPRFDTR